VNTSSAATSADHSQRTASNFVPPDGSEHFGVLIEDSFVADRSRLIEQEPRGFRSAPPGWLEPSEQHDQAMPFSGSKVGLEEVPK